MLQHTRIGLFGGSFNPPHVAHQIIAETVREEFELDVVLWMPGFIPPHKQDEGLAAPEHRLAMTRRAAGGNSGFDVSNLELRRENVSYTVDTIRELQNDHPNGDFFLIIGSDSLKSFDSWREPDEIIRRVPLIVFRRPGTESVEPSPAYRSRVLFADAPLIQISSTTIRERLRSGRSVRYMVPPEVIEYIAEHELYQI